MNIYKGKGLERQQSPEAARVLRLLIIVISLLDQTVCIYIDAFLLLGQFLFKPASASVSACKCCPILLALL